MGAIVIGAGLSGLACALHLERAGVAVTLLDAGDAPGGNLRTKIVPVDGGRYVLDLGPNSFGDGSADLMDLVRACGADADLVPAAEAACETRYIFRNGRIVPVDPGPRLLLSPLLPIAARLRLMCEPFIGRSRADAPEETLAAFCDRRLGRMARLKLLTPVVSGIYAGDPEKLGAESAFPAMIALEREHGSLVRAAMKGHGPPGRGRLQTFEDGLAALPRRIADALGAAYRPRTNVTSLTRAADGWRVAVRSNGTDDAGDEVLTARDVIVATPAVAAARLLADTAPGLAADLAAIRYAPMVVVHVGVRREDAGAIPDAFGVLVPREEGLRILGAIFSSRLFADRAPQGHELVTIFTGGDLDPEAPSLPDDEILAYVLRDLRTALPGAWTPALTRITRWPLAIPQYVVGHKDRVARIEAAERAVPGLTLLGNWRGGIAMPNCAREGAAAAAKVAERAGV